MNLINHNKGSSVTIVGGNARNKGALLMLQEAIKLIDDTIVRKVYIFTPFPEEDEPFISNLLKFKNLKFEIINWSRKEIIKTFLFMLLPFKKNKIIKSLENSQITLDISGISFVESRGFKYLVYNSLTVLIPFMCGSRIIKLPQSIGPIKSNYYKKISKYILTKCSEIYARGRTTGYELENLNIKFVLSSDLGFLNSSEVNIKNLVNNQKLKIGLNPSIVVKKFFEINNLDYESIMQNLIIELNNLGYELTIFPQSFSQKSEKSVFDDSTLVEKICKNIDNKKNRIINKDFSIEELNDIYSSIDVCVTSRFHGMIMSINNNVYPIVIGWNHKYQEVLDDIGLYNSSIKISETIISDIILCIEELKVKYYHEIDQLIYNRTKIKNRMAKLVI